VCESEYVCVGCVFVSLRACRYMCVYACLIVYVYKDARVCACHVCHFYAFLSLRQLGPCAESKLLISRRSESQQGYQYGDGSMRVFSIITR
jgi:hypothetical protein